MPSFLPSSSNMDANMDIMNPFNTLFVMDDPTTPLCVPVCNSFDQEFQFQENIQLNMLQQNTTLKSCGTAETCPTNALPHHLSDEQIELPLDLFDYLENVPFNIQEMFKEEDYGKVLGNTEYCHTSRRNPDSDILMSNELLPTPINEFVQAQGILELKNENILEDLYSFSPETSNEAEENVKREPLHLNLSSPLQPTSSSSGDVTTPVLIDMLLESEEIRKKKPVDVKPILVYSNLPHVLQDLSGESATECSLPPTPVPRTRTNTKRSSNPSKNSDLRRVRNNEASRKSRQNRRKKLQTQSQLVDILEEEGRCLTNKIKELETLKAEIMKYITDSNKTTTPNDKIKSS